MFECNELIYVQMQKTASQHIAKLLMQLFNGRIIGKHNSATPEQLQSNAYFVGSIRNPWDWYVSLWNFGVAGRGALLHNLTRREPCRAFKNILRKPTHWTAYQQAIDVLSKDVKKWRTVYSNDDEIASFRRWLTLIHNSNNYALDNSYGCMSSRSTKHYDMNERWGFMTYRYISLHCHCKQPTKELHFGDFERLQKFDNEYCYIHYFIRQEVLEDNLCTAIAQVKTLTDAEKSLIFNAKKTNTSARTLLLADYYDQASIDLVQEKERLIIEKFKYSPPTIST